MEEVQKILIKKEAKCNHCHIIYDQVWVRKVYGQDSKIVVGGFCSAECYINSLKS